jgi:hypothetical protein
MSSSPGVRILEVDKNRRGDLFGRLVGDLFLALGYEFPRLNIHKSGREIDLSADHRLERRRAVAECKATAERTGGDEINKFVGALDAETKARVPVVGYFISLAGFRETAIEQEQQGRRTPIITLTGEQVVEEMVVGRLLIPWTQATELAGRLCTGRDELTLDPAGELLAHERGWIWSVYYTHGKARTHFALIHSDGTPLARTLAEEVIASDLAGGGSLHALSCLNPATTGGGEPDPAAFAAYVKYLADECGIIQLDGLPADQDVGSRRLQLERLFIPLHLHLPTPDGGADRTPVGKCLATHPRLAILAPPGGGKSTLLKRLAIAYADPARRAEVPDDLPQRDWFPLFLRCRELRDLARGSFAELVHALSEREGVRTHAPAFREHVDQALLAGRVLLLVDGLDEISNAGDRAAFVSTIRSALLAHPGTALVVTSREAGFRHVAAHLAPVCTPATLSPFDAKDIRRLCQSWHREVLGDTEKVGADADQLTMAIVANDRILRLAVNPLLLTTLLLVKRWVGSLPTQRAVLYGKAVEVLLMTWNTEGHDPIPQDEALPQLCFVASAMMSDGVQKISRPRLAGRLREARDALPAELGYVQGTVEDFIRRVEDRSSLMMMTGHGVEDGQLLEFFEFRHLTFQEFLTARAVVEGWHPGRQENDTLVTVLEPHFSEDEWREVISLAAVLGRKGTEALILRLTELGHVMGMFQATTWSPNVPPKRRAKPVLRLLAACLADEAAARPETVRGAIQLLLANWLEAGLSDFGATLARGKYGAHFLTEARQAFFCRTSDLHIAAEALTSLIWHHTVPSGSLPDLQIAWSHFLSLLAASNSRERCEGALGLVGLYHGFDYGLRSDAWMDPPFPRLAEMLTSPEVTEVFAATGTLRWIGECERWPPPAEPDLLARLFELGWSHPEPGVRRSAQLALASQLLVAREDPRRFANLSPDQLSRAASAFESCHLREQAALLVVGWYKRAPWSDAELAERAKTVRDGYKKRHDRMPRAFDQLCRRLGIDMDDEPS